MKIWVIGGFPGCGKTTHAINEMLKNPGRYMFVTSRVDLITERIEEIRKAAAEKGIRVVTVSIHGETGRGKIPVGREITDAYTDYPEDAHVIVLVTHMGMMMADLSGYAGWHIYIDEPPPAVMSGSLRLHLSSFACREMYALDPIGATKWSELAVIPGGPSHRDILRDHCLRNLAQLDRCARSSQGAFANVPSWDDIIGSDRQVAWLWVWTPSQLAAFDTVTIVGAGYLTSIGWLAAKKLDPNGYTLEHVVLPKVERACPQIKIHYFAAHRGSTSFWKEEKGEECLKQAIDYMAEHVLDLGFWTVNTKFAAYAAKRMPGEHVTPKQEGSNHLRHHTSCAMLYSAKMTPEDRALREVLGLSDDEIERAREQEDILQFVCRGAIREASFKDTYSIYVYEEHQAETLAAYLRAHGIGTVELVPLDDAGLIEVERSSKPGRKPVLSAAERKANRRKSSAESQARRRAREKAQKVANGTGRGRGRPKKERA